MILLSITTTEAIRAVLGISATTEELPDSMFVESEFETELQVTLEQWLPETISTICAGAAAATTGYAEKLSLLKLCAQYEGALIVLSSAPLGFAQQLSDGQNEFHRDKKALAKLEELLRAKAGTFRTILAATYGETDPESADLFGSASPNYDPVTDTTV